MRARVLDTWQRLTGMAAPPALAATLTAALALRAALDDHHPWALHPARTLLILMQDGAETDPAVLAAAAAVDSLVPAWHAAPSVEAALDRVPGGLAALPEQGRGLLHAVPVPARAAEQLLEALLEAPRRVRLVACAERLDHARHLHMFEYHDPAGFRAEVAAVYQPVAARTDAQLERRFGRWLRAGERRGRPSA